MGARCTSNDRKTAIVRLSNDDDLGVPAGMAQIALMLKYGVSAAKTLFP